MMEQINNHLQKENLAWEKAKRKMFRDIKVSPEFENILKHVFLAGYNLGSIDGEEEIKEFAKTDPIGFNQWLNEE